MQKLQKYVDVYPWVKEIDEKGLVVIEGVYRHASLLSDIGFTPSILGKVTLSELVALRKLERHLGSVVCCLTRQDLPADSLWVSLAVNCVAPELASCKCKKIALLHDTMPLEGKFGRDGVLNYNKGATVNEAFLYVSELAKNNFSAKFDNKVLLPYTNFHSFGVLPTSIKDGQNLYSLSVGSLYRRKNLAVAIEVAKSFNIAHIHIGCYKDENTAFMIEQIECGSLNYLGVLPDVLLKNYMCGAYIFSCCSSDEGFSMTPMEAIICGSDYIVLSDIPAHREIYDGIANFITGNGVKLHRAVNLEARKFYFEKYSRENAVKLIHEALENL